MRGVLACVVYWRILRGVRGFAKVWDPELTCTRTRTHIRTHTHTRKGANKRAHANAYPCECEHTNSPSLTHSLPLSLALFFSSRRRNIQVPHALDTSPQGLSTPQQRRFSESATASTATWSSSRSAAAPTALTPDRDLHSALRGRSSWSVRSSLGSCRPLTVFSELMAEERLDEGETTEAQDLGGADANTRGRMFSSVQGRLENT